MAAFDWPNLVAMFFAQAERLGERPFLWRKSEGVYKAETWREIAAQVSALARGLKQLGLGRGDRVLLVAENRPCWLVADVGVMAAGCITVPAYTTGTRDDFAHVLNDSGAAAAIVSTRRLAERVAMAAGASPSLRYLIGMDPLSGLAVPASVLPLHWADVIRDGDGQHVNIVAEAAAIGPEEPACIIYTSGTGGVPKGVVLPHRAILHNCAGARDVLLELGLGHEIFLSFLPLSHAYEHTAGQFLPIAIGAEIYYAEGADKVAANMLEVKPTIVASVPRFYEVTKHRIEMQLLKAPRWHRSMVRMALSLGRKRLTRPEAWTPIDRALDWLADRLVRSRVRQRFGGRLKAMVSGGAPLDAEILLFFRALGVPVFQGYGQTEAGPLISVNRPRSSKIDSVGPPIKGAEVRIADDGEILVRGPLLMLGYWRNEEATRQAIQDGWLHTGDIGSLDADHHLRITDRKKDIIVNSGGDNVSPARIEGLLTLRPEIAQAMVYGDRRPHLVALIVPDGDWLRQWMRRTGRDTQDPDRLAADPELTQALQAVVDQVNAQLSVLERVRRILVVTEPLSIEKGELTPTLKLRRHVIRDKHGPALDALYRS